MTDPKQPTGSLLLNASWQPTRLLCPWDFPRNNTGVGHHFPLGWEDLPNPGIELAPLKFPALQTNSLPVAPPGKRQARILSRLNVPRNNYLFHACCLSNEIPVKEGFLVSPLSWLLQDFVQSSKMSTKDRIKDIGHVSHRRQSLSP